MGFTAIWRSVGEEGDMRVLIGHPGTYTETPEEAKDEGRKVLADATIDPAIKLSLMPLCVVETHEGLEQRIQDLDEVEVGDELLFYDITELDEWQSQSWWPKD